MQKGIEETGDMNDVTFSLELITIWDKNHFLKVMLVKKKKSYVSEAELYLLSNNDR